ncbi:N-acetyl-gamma-glutamyl-phosphate reductase, partial [bacterium]
SEEAQNISKVFPQFSSQLDMLCAKPDIKDIVKKCDLVFLALPHTLSMEWAPKLLKAGKRVIDLSADYRINDLALYKKFYGVEHKDKINLKTAVYGIPELYRSKIKSAKLVANPGCYPTAAILALAPLVSIGAIDISSIIIDAKSGVSGAGKKLVKEMLFNEVNEDFKAYKINTHQHMPEIEQILSKLSGGKVGLTFVPHLLPVNRGILETIYLNKNKNKIQNAISLYEKFYKNEKFVRVRKEGEFPALKDVVGTNFCDIAIMDCGDTLIVISAIDNLLKGASGQAVQNMNIMCGLPEGCGLL